MAAAFIAEVQPNGVVRITARVAGNQDLTLATVTQGMGVVPSTAINPGVTFTDGTGGLDWSTPVEDGINGVMGVGGVRGAGQFSISITLVGVGVIAPVVGSAEFNTNALAVIANILGVGVLPVAGDIMIITYTQPDGLVVTNPALHDGTGIENDDWAAFAYQIDGSLLVNGTVVADTIRADTVISNNVQSNPYNAGINGYSLNGTTGDAEFNNVTIRGDSTVDSTSIQGTGIWGVAERGLSIMSAQSFADELHSLDLLEEIRQSATVFGSLGYNNTSTQPPGQGYGVNWDITTVSGVITASIGISSGSTPIYDDAVFNADQTGGFILRWIQNSAITGEINTSYFEGWTGTGNTGTLITDRQVTISNDTKLAGPDLEVGNTNPANVTFFNGLIAPTVFTEFTSYINRQDGQFSVNPDMLFQYTRVPVTTGTNGAITFTQFRVSLNFRSFDLLTQVADTVRTPDNMTLTEDAAGQREIAIDGLTANQVNSLVRIGTAANGFRIEFQPAAFPNMPALLPIGTIVEARVSFTFTGSPSNFRGLRTFSNVRDISVGTGRPSLYTTLALDTTDTVASIGSADPDKFNLTVAGGLGTRILYDRVFDGRSNSISGIDLGKAGFVMVRWDKGDLNDGLPNVGIYPFQNAFFTNQGDQLQSVDSNDISQYYVEQFVGSTSNTGESSIKLVDVIDNGGDRKGSLWIRVTDSGLSTELLLTPEGTNTGVLIIGVFITSWNFGSIISVDDIRGEV